ncbi:MAG TPA: Gmad2 immunoglobulin-like domain-containing protein [Mycobacteriales bacterium]|nr:Gmad2 immunoglobulin-like domain-containing protein [Mycobacteriales bacterium]
MGFDRRTAVVILALLVAAAGIGVGAGALLGDRKTAGRPADAALTGPGTASPTAGAAPVPQRTATRIPGPLPGATAQVPVYVLGGAGAAARLYREFRSGDSADPVRAAVAGLAAAPADPDYRSPWLGVPSSVTRSGPTATVTFSAAPALAGAGPAVAVQQVVYTVTAADTAVTRVRVVAPGLPAALTATAAGRGAQADLLAPVWLLDPIDGGAAGTRLRITGTASVFEATVSIEVRRGSAVLARTTATASVGAPGRGEWAATVSVPAGDYVISAYEASEKDGARVGEDTKRVTVT